MYKKINLQIRSNQTELLDEENIPFDDIKKNMQEINIINKLLGGHTITISGFKKLLGNRKSIHVCEIGCGDGNNLVQLQNWCKRNKIKFSCTGIDIKPQCIEAAKTSLIKNANWINSDYTSVQFETKPDIIYSSLFCHHFTDNELIFQLQWMKENSTIGFFINDLQRNWFAFHSIRIITQIFSSSYLVKNDAPQSVARGFHKNEWQTLLKQACIKNYTIDWRWAFRYLLIYKHDN